MTREINKLMKYLSEQSGKFCNNCIHCNKGIDINPCKACIPNYKNWKHK